MNSHIFVMIGTKGQYVKMAPVLQEMGRRGLPYTLIDANQHPLIAKEIRKTFGLPEPQVSLFGLKKDVATTSDALAWMAKNLSDTILGKHTFLKDRYFHNRPRADRLMFIHGDAPPALLALLAAWRYGLRVAHIEAGERTHNPFQPFPEELIRRMVDRFSDLLFACSPEAIENLESEKAQGKIIDLGMNTVLDAIRIVLQRNQPRPGFSRQDYVLIYVHRYETLHLKRRMRLLVDLLQNELKCENLVMTLHESTRHSLARFGLLDRILGLRNLTVFPLLPYHEFINLMAGAKFLITDGGGPQQESHILGIPCLILREQVELPNFENIFVAGFDYGKIKYFLANLDSYRIKEGLGRFDHIQPSRRVVDYIQREL